MSNSLLLNYNQNQDMLDKDSEVSSIKEEEKEENLISDNNYSDYSITSSSNNNSSSQCIIHECSDLGENLVAITEDDSDNCIPYFVCDRHYHELMTEN
jgi:hypothetical protein